jgi:tetratricopeptide (TPR) repeat protein
LAVVLSVPMSAVADDQQDCMRVSGELSVAACSRILERNPEEGWALLNRGISYSRLGDYDRALADLNAVMHIGSITGGAHYERGLARAGKGDYAAAISDFDEALRMDPGLAVVAHFARAMAAEDSGQPERAKADLDEAMRHDPKFVAALWMQRGHALRKLGKHEKAITAFDKVVALQPNWLLAYSGRGATYEDKGDNERAAADYRKVLELAATSENERIEQDTARNHLERLGTK